MRILYTGTLGRGGTARMRMEALQSLGHDVESVDFDPETLSRDQAFVGRVLNKLGQPPDWAGTNEKIRTRCAREHFDVLWIDKGNIIQPGTLRAIRRMTNPPRIVGYSPDDMAASHNSSLYFLGGLPFYDAFFTTKSYGVAELTRRGCPKVVFNENAYDPTVHAPFTLSPEEERLYGTDVGFIGTYEAERAAHMLYLEHNGIPVRIHGGVSWLKVPERKLYSFPVGPGFTGVAYAKAICGAKINLAFLRKMNRDLQTQRSVEIPACNSFMLAERTAEHLGLFEEGKEAEFFSSREEMLEKVRYYLAHPEKRQLIADAGRRRCLTSGYSYAERLRVALEAIG